MKHESRRYNAANETGKEFYKRRKMEMDEWLESPETRRWMERSWAEYRKKNCKNHLTNE